MEASQEEISAEWLAAKACADDKLRLATDAWIAAERASNAGDMRGYRYFSRLALRRDAAAEKAWQKALRLQLHT